MSDPDIDKDGEKIPADDEVDGLLESLTTNDGYREEQATLPFNPETMHPASLAGALPTAPPPPRKAPDPPPVVVEKPRVPLPGARGPRPAEAAASGPPKVLTSTRPRPIPRPAKGLPGGSGIDDAEIDAALSSLSAAPAAPTAPPAPIDASALSPGADLDVSGATTSLAPNPDSWAPPAFDSESLDDLEAVELDEDETGDYAPPPRPNPSLAELAATLTTGAAVDLSGDAISSPGVDALDEELDDWDEDRITSVPEFGTGRGTRPPFAKTTAPPAVKTTTPPFAKTTAPPASADVSTSVEELGGSSGDAEIDALLGLGESEAPKQRDTTPAPTSAVAHLGGHRLIDAWVARAEWFEAEALSTDELHKRARLLLAASELWAMAGSIGRSRSAATRAAAAWPSLSLASQQARALAAIEGDFKAAAATLDVESRSAPTDAARAHAAYFAAEVHRVVLADADGAERRLDLLARTAPDDPRPYLARLAADLGSGAGAPKTSPPGSPELQPLAAAHAELSRLRALAPGEEPRTPTLAFKDAGRAAVSGDLPVAGDAVLALRDVPGIGDGALLLAAALFAPAAETRPRAIDALRTLLDRKGGSVVRRALAARALEQGDRDAMALALREGEPDEAAFTPSDRVALGALTGGEGSALFAAAETIAGDESQRPLAAAAASASAIDAVGLPVGDPVTHARIALGRKLATVASYDELKDPVHAFRAAAPEATLGKILALELDAAASATTAVATELARLAPADDPGKSPEAGSPADGKLAAALIEEASGRGDAARRNYTAALGFPERAESAARALSSSGDQNSSDLFAMLAASLGEEPTRQSLLLYEAAIRGGLTDPAAAEDLLTRAHEAAPALPFASRAAVDLARKRGDVPKLLDWLRKQQSAATDPILRALGAVREALLIADDDPAGAASCLSIAVTTRPDDVALRELEGRLSPAPNMERGRWRERVAEAAVLPRTKAWFLFEAAAEYEKAGSLEDAQRATRAAADTGVSDLARVGALATGGEQRSTLEGLSEARAAEQKLLGAGPDEDLEELSAKLIDQLDRGEAFAHARLAARLRTRRLDWESTRELSERASTKKPASLWTLRQARAHARAVGDDARLVEVDQELSGRAERQLDRATLLLRAAEAAARLGRASDALALVTQTLELSPDHLVALDLRASLETETGLFAEAAENLETLARALVVGEHQCDAWYRAAVLWADKVGEQERSLTALENVALLDISKHDVFDRLQQQYVRRGDRAKLAELLEARLARTTAPEERISLEVNRGRALADVGDRDAARKALGAALEANPDHADALEAYANLALSEREWKRAEETWIRLARVAGLPEKQAEVYGRLAELYDSELPNPQRAEICYREILKRKPNDPEATGALVRVYGRLGDVVKAVQLQTELVERATDPDEKRARTLALAEVYDETAKDKRSALAILEKARKAWPHDAFVLRGMARHHRRHGEAAAENVLLDRAAAEARRALTHGRFDLAFFGVLEAVADVRGEADAAQVAGATLAALEGKGEVAVPGAGASSSAATLDDLTAPELLGPALRTLLAKLPTVLDAAYPVDLKALRAAPLPPTAAELGGEIRAVAESMGTRSLELLVSPMLGAVFLPASCTPARIVIGQSLLDSQDDAARYFLLVRALKMIQAEVAALSRIAPIELPAVLTALLSTLAPSWQASGVDPNKLAEARRRVEPVVPPNAGADLATLALEIGGTIGNRASQVGQAVAQWASRTALLAVGSPSLALKGVALALGQSDVPSDLAERLKWVLRYPEARDLCVFSVSEGYAEARRRVGLGV